MVRLDKLGDTFFSKFFESALLFNFFIVLSSVPPWQVPFTLSLYYSFFDDFLFPLINFIAD